MSDRDGLGIRAREHAERGRQLDTDAGRIFVREEGAGPAVLLLHGVPSTSFLYRKMMAPLAAAGLRAVAFDFPGMGLSDKPRDAAYDWHALAGAVRAVVDALELGDVHLVVHDIGGPVGFEWAVPHPERVRRLTILNTLLDVAVFHRPFPMWMYATRGLGEVVLATQNRWLMAPIMWRIGALGPSSVSLEDIDAYLELVRRDGGHATFLRIMRGFVLTPEHGRFLLEGLRAMDTPMQLVWGRDDPAIPRHQRDFIERHLDLAAVHEVRGRHFLQEDSPEEIAALIAGFEG